MKPKIVLIENEESTIQIFMQLSSALNIDYMLLPKWNPAANLQNKKNIKALFINVELNFMDLQTIFRSLMVNSEQTKIPIYYLYSKSFNKNYQAAKKLPHDGELKKPVKVEELFKILDHHIDLEKLIDYPEEKYRKKLKTYRTYLAATRELINKLEAYFE